MSIDEILNNLDELFPNARCELEHRNNYEMVVAVILSAQTTDASVNKVTKSLFQKYPTASSLANADIKDIEKEISSLGLYRNKAKAIQGMAQKLVNDYNGVVPNKMNELVKLPGVGRKCANVILSECYNIPSLAVDTHVNRVSKRLGLARKEDSVFDVERKLKRKIPRDKWIKCHHQFIFFGRYLCHSRYPECEKCPFTMICKDYKLGVK